MLLLFNTAEALDLENVLGVFIVTVEVLENSFEPKQRLLQRDIVGVQVI